MIRYPSLLDLIHRVGQAGTERFVDKSPGGLTLRQAVVLNGIAKQPAASQSALVVSSGIDRSTVTEIMKRLVKQGVARRRRSRSDTRVYMVDITDHGRKALDAAAHAISTIEAELMGAIPNEDRQ